MICPYGLLCRPAPSKWWHVLWNGGSALRHHQTRRSPAVPGPLVTVFRLCCLPCNAGATGTEIANFVETCVIEIVQDLEADRGGLKKLQRKKHAKFVMCEPQVRSGKPIRRINTSTRMFDRIDIFDESFWYHLKFPDS